MFRNVFSVLSTFFKKGISLLVVDKSGGKWRKVGRLFNARKRIVPRLLVSAAVIVLTFPAALPESVLASTCATSGNNVTLGNCTLDAGTYTYTGTLTFASGQTVIIASDVGNGPVIINAANVQINGTIDGRGRGYAAGTGPGVNSGAQMGASYGGNGGSGNDAPGYGPTYGDVRWPEDMGSGAFQGTAGGASFQLLASGDVTFNDTGSFSTSGRIIMSGQTNGNDAGTNGTGGNGGSGGSIIIDADDLIFGGGVNKVVATGGNGCTLSDSPSFRGGGGGGRIALYYNTTDRTDAHDASGGYPCESGISGGVGSVFYDDKNDADTNGRVVYQQTTTWAGSTPVGGRTTQVSELSEQYDELSFGSYVRYYIPDGYTLTADSVPSPDIPGQYFLGGYALYIEEGGEFVGPADMEIWTTSVENHGTISGVTNLSTTSFDFTNYGTFDSLDSLTTLLPNGAIYRHCTGSPLNITTIDIEKAGTLTSCAGMPLVINAVNVNLHAVSSGPYVGSPGTISVSGLGSAAASGTSPGGSVATAGAGGGAHGGLGGAGTGTGGTGGSPTYGLYGDPTEFGSGGGTSGEAQGTGGAGGGILEMNISGNFSSNGAIRASGAQSMGRGGGGAGGSIKIITNTWNRDGANGTGLGTIRADGGGVNGNSVGLGGGCGAGGRILMFYESSTTPNDTTLRADGGQNSDGGCLAAQYGGAGTIFQTPVITTISPSSISTKFDAGSGSQTIQVNGSNSRFVSGASVVLVDGSDAYTTNYINANRLDVVIPAADLLTPDVKSIQVRSSLLDGGTSNSVNLTITEPAATTTDIAPSFAVTGDPDVEMLVSGTNFRSTSFVRWDGVTDLTPDSIDSTGQLTVTIPAALITDAGVYSVQVINPDGGSSGVPRFFTVYDPNPVPTLTSVDPDSADVGDDELEIELVGTNFMNESEVYFDGEFLNSVYVDATHLTATIPQWFLAEGGTFDIVVVNPAPGGGTSDPVVFSITSPVPTIGDISPTTHLAGDNGFYIYVTGEGFNPGSVINIGGNPYATDFGDVNNLQVLVSQEDALIAGTFGVTVVNPPPGGGTSNSIDLVVSDPDSDWTLGVTPTGETDWQAVANDGAGRIVSVGSDGNADERAMYSDNDGATWTQVTTPSGEEYQWYGLEYGEGRFVALGSYYETDDDFTYGAAMYSDDGGETWTLATAPSDDQNYWKSVAYGEGRFVTTGTFTTFDYTLQGAAYMTSEDGITWTYGDTDDSIAFGMEDVTFGAGTFVAVGSGYGGAASTYSDDGLTWNSGTLDFTSGNPYAVIYGDEGFVAIGEFFLQYSVDGGQNWTNGNNFWPTIWNDITYSDGFYVAVGSPSDGTYTTIFYSSDAIDWYVDQTPILPTQWLGITVSSSEYIAVGAAAYNEHGTMEAMHRGIYVPNPAPTLTSIDPTSATAGDGDTLLDLYGTNFIPTSEVSYNGDASDEITFIDDTHIQWTISEDTLLSGGSFAVFVTNPGPGGGDSTAETFDVFAVEPVLTSLSISSTVVGAGDLEIELNGSDFAPNAVARFGGNDLDTSFDSDTLLIATIPANYLDTVGTFPVTVFNPGAGGGESSNALDFDVVTADWSITNTPNVATTWLDVTEGGGTLVAVGVDGDADGRAMYSTDDGTTWNIGETPADQPYEWQGVTYDADDNVFVAVGHYFDGFYHQGSSMISSDGGETWTANPLATADYNGWNDVTYDNGTFVAVGFMYVPDPFEYHAATAYSADGVNWSAGLDPGTVNSWNGVEASGGRFIAVGNDTAPDFSVAYSDDGLNWFIATTPAINDVLQGVAFGGGNVVAVGPATALYSSDNGETWSSGNPFGGYWRGVTYADGFFMAVGQDYSGPSAMYSIEGLDWYESTTPNPGATWFAVTPGAARYVSVGYTAGVPQQSAMVFSYGTLGLNPTPTLTSMDPSQAVEGDDIFVITVTGTDFVDGAVVRFDGNDLDTTYIDDTHLTATVTSDYLTTAGTYPITVFNPGPGGGESGSLDFEVIASYPTPTITTLTPDEIAEGNATFDVVIEGTGFFPASVAQWEGSDRDTTYVDETHVSIEIMNTDVVADGTFQITVTNPAPGGGVSNELDFTVTAVAPPSLGTATTNNRILQSRMAPGLTSSMLISFHMPNEHEGGVTTVTFPAEFTILGAPTSEFSHECFTNFGFDNDAHTVFATKTACGGDVDLHLGGFSVVNPATPGTYFISWENDDPGEGAIVITADQITITASVDPSITFDVWADTDDCAYDGMNGDYAVALGVLNSGSVTTSDAHGGAGTIDHVCVQLETNAASGAVVTVESLNAALASTSVPADTVPANSGAITAGSAEYGMCLNHLEIANTTPIGTYRASGGSQNEWGGETMITTGATTTDTSATCDATTHGTTTAFSGGVQNVLNTSVDGVAEALATFLVKAAISGTSPAHTDYTDTLTFVATGTF